MVGDPEAPRYSRQVLFPPIGVPGQARLLASRVAILGCGALGTALSEQVVRAGVGHVRLIDRDVVEPSNLGRQALYTTKDAEERRPKAEALADILRAFNPDVELEPRVAHFDATNVDELLGSVDLVLDGTDNLDARYLLNDWCVRAGVPWIYGACVASRGMTAVILPGETPCLRCLFPEPPPAGSLETCDTSGILGPAAQLVAALQVVEALKILTGAHSAVRRGLVSWELWQFRMVELGGAAPQPRAGCACCSGRQFPWLERTEGARVEVACGRDGVQVIPAARRGFDLSALEQRLEGRFPCRRMGSVLRIEHPEHPLIVFDDGRALVSGTSDGDVARSLYDRVVGA